jgi:outer membrane receptor protein involved in Fe transport
MLRAPVSYSLLSAGFACISMISPAFGEAVQTGEEKPAPLTLSALEVFADRPADAAGPVYGLDAQSLARIDAERPAEALNSVPGVNIQMNAGVENLIALRSPVLTAGAAQGSVLILENGAPIRPAAFGNVNALFELALPLAEGIEVVAGPASAAYGSNAVHGLINLALPLPDGGNRQEARVSVSSLARTRTTLQAELPLGLSAGGGGLQPSLWSGLSLVTEGGWRAASGLSHAQAAAVVRWPVAAGEWLVWASATNLNQETAGFVEGPNAYRDAQKVQQNNSPQAFRDAKAVRIAARWSQPFGAGEFTITPFARWQDMRLSQHFLIYQGTEENDSASLGLMASLKGKTDGFDWQVGVDLDRARGGLTEVQDLPSFGAFPQGVHYDYSVDTTQAALWAQSRLTLTDTLRLEAGLRAESMQFAYDTDAPVGTFGRFRVVPDRKDDYAVVTPKLGLIWDISPELAGFARYARGSRAPQANDLYRLQNRQSPGEIKVETLDNIEFGGRLTTKALAVQAVIWAQDKQNVFFRDADGLNVPDGATRGHGVEMQASGQAHSALDWGISLAWSDHRYAFDRAVSRAEEAIRKGDQVDTAPHWLADVSLNYRPDESSEWSLKGEYVGEYVTNAANTARYPGHTVWQVSARLDLTDRVQVFAQARNLFDRAYADRADFAFGTDRYFPGEPRNLTLGVRLTGGDLR